MKASEEKSWISKHKGAIFAGLCGVGVFALSLYFLCSNSHEEIGSIGKDLNVEAITGRNIKPNFSYAEIQSCGIKGTPKCPHQVSGHIRNLGLNKSASIAKQESASLYGIVLKDHQTWVSSYSTGNRS